MCIKRLFLAISAFFISNAEASLKVGDLAPDFALYDQSKTLHKLSDQRNKKIIALCFYPKDDTPGCTAEVCSLRNGWNDLQNAGVSVWGISFDSTDSHANFAANQKLNFPILSDINKAVTKMYGVKHWFLPIPNRTTFLIDKEGKITHIIDNVDTENHAQQILRLISR